MAHGYRSWSPLQCSLLPQNPADWLPKGHIAPILLDVIDVFDLRSFRYQGCETRGAAGFDPAMMVVLVLYCMLHSQMSARSMERFLMSDLGGRFLCGDCEVPGWRCIAAFRQENRERLAGLFAQSVQCCIEARLVDSSLVFGDGSKFEAQASKQSNITYGRADNALAKLQKRFDTLMAEADRLDVEEGKAEEAARLRGDADKASDQRQRIIEAKSRMDEAARLNKVEWEQAAPNDRPHRAAPTGTASDKDRSNLVDPESRLMKFKDGSFKQAYNVQLAAEGSNQIILGVSVSNDGNDFGQLQSTVEHVLETTNCRPNTWVADGGYLSEANLAYLDSLNIDPIISPERRTPKDQADQNPTTDDPKTANPKITQQQKSNAPKRRRAKPKKPVKLSNAKSRMRAKLATDEGKKIYSRRCQVIEPIFGQIKGCPGHPGMTRFTVRGTKNCADVMQLQCAVHNIRKYINEIFVNRLKKGFSVPTTSKSYAAQRYCTLALAV